MLPLQQADEDRHPQEGKDKDVDQLAGQSPRGNGEVPHSGDIDRKRGTYLLIG